MQNRLRTFLILGLQIAFFCSLVSAGLVVALNKKSETNQASPYSTSRDTASSDEIHRTNELPAYGSVRSGIYINDVTPSYYEWLLSHDVSIVSWFVHWDEKMDNNKLAYACKNGYIPQITWESRNKGELKESTYSLESIGKGAYDEFIRTELESVKKICGDRPVIIRFDHEMDTEIGKVRWYPWQGNPEQYIDAWKRIVNISHEINSNVKWLWSPNRGKEVTLEYYPGDEYVDYVGLTLNRNPKDHPYLTFGYFYEPNKKIIESFNKPVIISETTYDEAGGDAKSKAAWIDSMADYIKSNPKIVAFSWFSARFGHAIDSSAESVEAAVRAYELLEPNL